MSTPNKMKLNAYIPIDSDDELASTSTTDDFNFDLYSSDSDHQDAQKICTETNFVDEVSFCHSKCHHELLKLYFKETAKAWLNSNGTDIVASVVTEMLAKKNTKKKPTTTTKRKFKVSVPASEETKKELKRKKKEDKKEPEPVEVPEETQPKTKKQKKK